MRMAAGAARPVVGVLLLAAASLGCGDASRVHRVESVAVRCAVDSGPCVATAPGIRSLSLEVWPRPVRPLTELTFRVDAREASGRELADPELTLELRMTGMAMGVNRIVLAPRGGGRYEGRGALVRCASGRRDWEAAVSGRSFGTVRFAFEAARS